MGLLSETVRRIVPQDRIARDQARKRLERLTMPFWALGKLMDLAMDLAGMTGSVRPPVERKVIVTMAADHGVVAAGVSKYPQEVTLQMVHNFVREGAGINALSRVTDTGVVVVDMGVAGDLGELVDQGLVISKRIGPGTSNMVVGPAMTRDEAVRSVEAGIEVAQALTDSTDVFGTGEMGIGNTTASSAIVAAFTNSSPALVTGRGTGVDDAQLALKIDVVGKALEVNKPDVKDPMDVLSKVGGFEIGGLAGLILGAASMRKPVLIDGFISTAAALIARGIAPAAAQYMIAAHRSAEQGHGIALDHLGKQPLLDLEMRLGEGTGAAMAMTLVEAAFRILTEVATFEEASVSEAER